MMAVCFEGCRLQSAEKEKKRTFLVNWMLNSIEVSVERLLALSFKLHRVFNLLSRDFQKKHPWVVLEHCFGDVMTLLVLVDVDERVFCSRQFLGGCFAFI